jgi:hypothetical protein
MMRFFLLFIFIQFISSSVSIAQQDDYQLGVSPNYVRQAQGALFDYSDPDGINIKVSVWGYVKYPGRYVIPQRSDIRDLISYAGGINDDSHLDEIKLYRIQEDSSQVILNFNYEDLWWEKELKEELKLERLMPGDILIIPGRNRLYWENYLSLGLSILGVLLSVATIIITANK